MVSNLRWSLAIIMAYLGACTSDRDQVGPAYTVTDSAGTEVVESKRPAWINGSPWKVGDEPRVAIGRRRPGEAYALYQVGPVFRMPEVRTVVANGGTNQLRVFGREGGHLFDIGGKGDGPGEFRALRRAWRVWNDSLLVYDSRLSRVSIFDAGGNLGRVMTLRAVAPARHAFGMRPFDDGTLLVEGVVPVVPGLGLFYGGRRIFLRYTAHGEPGDSIGGGDLGPHWGYLVGESQGYSRAPFALSVVPSVGDGQTLYFASGTDFVVSKVTADGKLTRIIRWAGTRRDVTAKDRERYAALQRGQVPDPEFPNLAAAKLDGIVYPTFMPTLQRLLVDTEGYLWVEDYSPPWQKYRAWSVFDPDGRWLGQPPIPPDLDLREVGSDYVLGVRRNEADVEEVVMYELRR